MEHTIQINLDEALRYAGVRPPAPEDLRARAEALSQMMRDKVTPRYTWRMSPLVHQENMPVLVAADILLPGRTADRMLADCDSAVVLVCTLGTPFDMLLRQTEARDMADALLLNGCGAAYVEAACDAAEREVAEHFPKKHLTDRFSPGYGDLPLSLQASLLSMTDASRRLGVTLSDSCLMNPVKSVTAIIGLSDHPQQAKIRGCDFCTLRTRCQLRKAGKSCGESTDFS